MNNVLSGLTAEFLQTSVYFGVFLTILAFMVGSWMKNRFKLAIFNPILIAVILIIFVLLLFDVDYASYKAGANLISYLLTPATICLAVPLYEQWEMLKKNYKAVVAGITSGVLTSLCTILVLALLFHLDHTAYVTLLPKSITTAIGMGVSEELGGYVSITVAVIIFTGITGNMLAETVCKVFRITDPVAKGIGIGTASHAIGTSKASEMGEVEGAMSGLSIGVAGILTVFGASVFGQFL